MKSWYCLLACLISFQAAAQVPAYGPSLKVMSFNLRLDVASDGYNAWPHRKDLVKTLIDHHQLDLLGVQEALPHQVEELKTLFPYLTFVGQPRDTGRWGETAAIGYRASRLTFLEGGTFWLSETPDQMSKGWDAALNRTVSWGKFADKKSGHHFFHFNTHFDHRGEVARLESARLIIREMARLNPEQLPALLTGDFNATPESAPIQALLTEEAAVKDAMHESVWPSLGPESTWSGFKFPGEPGRRIDYVFVQGSPAVLRHAILTDSWSGRFPSDHLPVLAEVLLNPPQAIPQAHAHNDYEHEEPLWEALRAGFTQVEADVWAIDGALYVKHGRPVKLADTPTLQELYLDPLRDLVESYNGQIFPGQEVAFRLMIDIKSGAAETYELLRQALRPYRFLFVGEKAPVVIFLSGNRPVQQVLEAEDDGLALDGRPGDLGKGIPVEKMPVVSDT
ncbi:MAG: endonuclease/exonuclease/phosphatase family protein, partial [Bacteroidota bacterium]